MTTHYCFRTGVGAETSSRKIQTFTIIMLIALLYPDIHVGVNAYSTVEQVGGFSAPEMMRILYISVEEAFDAFVNRKMKCGANDCTEDHTTLELTAMPKFKSLTDEDDSSICKKIQENYESLQTFQYFIAHYLKWIENTEIDREVKTVDNAFARFKIKHSQYVMSTLCETPTEITIDPVGYPIHHAPSPIIEKARIYEFLLQYKNFLSSFQHAYLIPQKRTE
ncbi:uncharacterized protein LOC120348264 [Styela clava]|uniref:uncharacterized protein LOC120348264 n=1 Tax=Styela clava TaxID=7725 RepID=UPI00193A570F|nr:uncharacterized protein LOC120348264 [Styela clava]